MPFVDESRLFCKFDKPKCRFMKRYLILKILIFLIACSGCLEKKVAVKTVQKVSGQYDSHFPSGNVTHELDRIAASVKKVYCISSYTTYQFKRESGITTYHIHTGSYKKAAWGIISTNETVFGTATIITQAESRVALLTCAHIVNSPDTLISFFETDDDDPLVTVRSFSVKEKQEIWVKDLSSCGPFTLLASDIQNDIAIIGKKCESLTDTVIPFSYPAGRARDLGLGSFVYILGYPLGNMVITTAIASPMQKRPQGEFTIDALLNKGCSGGIILAIRDGAPNFELAGMVKNVNSTHEEFLMPEPDKPRNADWLPYKGDAYVGMNDNLQYGMNSVVPVESILEFFKKNRQDLISTGYNPDSFFLPQKP
jgi:hypothetical protein